MIRDRLDTMLKQNLVGAEPHVLPDEFVHVLEVPAKDLI